MSSATTVSGSAEGEGGSGTDDEVRLLRAELAATRRDLADALVARDVAVSLNAEYVGQLRSLTSSVSWRITRPYRVVRRLFRGRR